LEEKYQLDIENLVHVPYEQILDAYKRCDLLCFPSFYEGFGLPIVEAQAIGRPVITSNFGAMKEVAGEGAVLVNPEEVEQISLALLAIAKKDKKRKSLVEGGRKNVERYMAIAVSKQYESVYLNVIE